MALKMKIEKATYDALPDPVKAEYKAVGADYMLDLEGYEDPAELKRAKDREAQSARTWKQKAEESAGRVAELEAEMNDPAKVDARKKGDIAALEASWKGKLAEAQKQGADAVTKMKDFVRKQMREAAAATLAGELFTAPKIGMPHLLSRLEVDFEGDEPILRVLDAKGVASAATMDDLRKETVANADFAAIIIGSKGSGGGAPGGRQGGGGATKQLSEMNSTERTEFHKRDPEGFKKASEAQPRVVRI